MKKAAILIIIALLIIFLYKEGVFNKYHSKILDSKAVLVSEGDDLVGLWTMTDYKSSQTDDGVVEASAIELVKDGSCTYVFSYRMKTGSLWEGKYEGKCYVDESKKHFKFIDNEGNERIKWTKYTVSGNTLKWGPYTFDKVR